MQVPRGETRVSMPRTSDVRPRTKRGVLRRPDVGQATPVS